MHPTDEELLAQRDGEAGPAVAAHVAACARCRERVEAMRAVRRALKRLPEVGPTRDGWTSIEAELGRPRIRRRWLAAAAAVLVIAGGSFVGHRVFEHTRTARPEAAVVEAAAVVDELVAASRELEGLLDGPNMRSRVMNPRQAATIVSLEDRIAEVDVVLAAGPTEITDEEALALWSHRVRLLAALVQLRGAPGSTPPFQHAVHTERSNT
ncbi:MAG: hypothetical protein V2I67_03695 [Thermoanaerobaculales bacterium]|nr:hypothetical protein [Thermoanaerobaculales bacterium]